MKNFGWIEPPEDKHPRVVQTPIIANFLGAVGVQKSFHSCLMKQKVPWKFIPYCLPRIRNAAVVELLLPLFLLLVVAGDGALSSI